MRHPISRNLMILSFVVCVAMTSVQPTEAGLGKLWPFASKKHIKNQLDPVTGRVGELEEISRQHAARIKDVDERAQAGIQSATRMVEEADAKAVLADQNAVKAGEAAKEGQVQLGNVQTQLDQRISNLDNFQEAKLVRVTFKFNQTALDKESKAALAELAGELKGGQGYVLDVQGFTDHHGSEPYNLELSQKRAESVVRYLVEEQQVPLFRVRTLGMGKAQAVKNAQGQLDSKLSRRVEVHLLRSEAMEVASK